MKKLIVPIAIVGMMALIAAAAVLDCVRLAANARQRVALADVEMQKHEARLAKLLSGYAKVSPEVQSDLTAYQAAGNPADRRHAYESLVTSFQKTMSGSIDPTNPLDRKFMDDVTGSINRREVAEKQFDQEQADYQRFLATGRGAVARKFSEMARDDSKPTE